MMSDLEMAMETLGIIDFIFWLYHWLWMGNFILWPISLIVMHDTVLLYLFYDMMQLWSLRQNDSLWSSFSVFSYG